MNDGFGTTTWAARREGRLSPGETARELLQGLMALGTVETSRLAWRLGLGPRGFTLALAEVSLPRTALAMAAEARLGQANTWIVAHSMRTYLWGALLARRDGVSFDAELAFAAAALHDLGLTVEGPETCFAHRGAELARQTCLAAGVSAERAAVVADAVCQHLDVDPSRSPEAHLVRAGAGYDVVGDRFLALATPARREVLASWPRADFAARVTEALMNEARRHPGTRIALLCATLRFPALIARADRWFVKDGA